MGKELKVKCDGSHEHQPLVDGRAKDAARYPPALCRAICRGLQKEKMQRCMQVRAVLEVGEGVHKRPLDTEGSHDEEIKAGSSFGSVLGPLGWVGLEGYEEKPVKANRWDKEEMRLGRLTEYKKKSGDISSVLAWDDLTGMKLDAGKVKEARA